MQTYKVLSEMLSYPADKIQDIGEYEQIVRKECGEYAEDFHEFCINYANEDLYSLQEEYVSLFDISRDTSLNLFDHMHKTTKDRGPAMVELIKKYSDNGLTLMDEMPDHLPVVLEYMSAVRDDAGQTAADFAGAVAGLHTCLEKTGSKYSILTKITSSLFATKAIQKGGV